MSVTADLNVLACAANILVIDYTLASHAVLDAIAEIKSLREEVATLRSRAEDRPDDAPILLITEDPCLEGACRIFIPDPNLGGYRLFLGARECKP